MNARRLIRSPRPRRPAGARDLDAERLGGRQINDRTEFCRLSGAGRRPAALLPALRFGDQALPVKRVGAAWVANEKMIAPLTKHPCHFAGPAS
jgi:hypothetical protein